MSKVEGSDKTTDSIIFKSWEERWLQMGIIGKEK